MAANANPQNGEYRYSSIVAVRKACKAYPGKVLPLDSGDGWTSLWLWDDRAKGRGNTPRCVGQINPEGMSV